MKKIEEYTADELSKKIEAIKAECEKTANALKKYEEELEHDNSELQHKLDMAIEALKFYAADENYHMHGTYGNTNVRNDNGKIAREALEEIEK